MTRRTISVVMPTNNVERIIEKSLDSLKWVDEIIVIDRFSMDRTRDICSCYENVRFHQREGYISQCFNEATEMATGDWIMRNDADEIITPMLADEIQRVVLTGNDEFDGYFVREVTYFYGKWVSCTALRKGYRNGKEKLFRKGFFCYEVKREHEPPITKGRWGYLDNFYLHYSIPTVATQIRKIAYHAQKDADRIDVVENPPMPALMMVYRTLKSFVSIYFKNHGYRMGYHGIAMAMLEVFYAFTARVMTWEKWYKHHHGINEAVFPPAPEELTKIIGHDIRYHS